MRAVVFAYHNVGDRCLRVLHARGVDVALVVTHRDRADENIWFARVADTAAELNLSFLYGEDPSDPALADAVRPLEGDGVLDMDAALSALFHDDAFPSVSRVRSIRVPGREQGGCQIHAAEILLNVQISQGPLVPRGFL